MQKLNERIKVLIIQYYLLYLLTYYFKQLETTLDKEEKSRQDLETDLANIIKEKNDLYMQLQIEKDALSASEEKTQKFFSLKLDLERQINV